MIVDEAQRNEIERLVRAFGKRMSKVPVGIYASSAAFFIFTAIIPLIMLVCAVLPYTSLDPEDVTFFLMHISPSVASQVVDESVSAAQAASSRGVIVVSTIVALWLASVAMLAVMRGLNAIYHVKKHRNYFAMRGISCIYTLLFIAICIVLMFVMIFGRTFNGTFEHMMPYADKFAFIPLGVRYVVSALLLVPVFLCCYAIVPVERQPFVDQIPGSVFSAAGWTVSSAIFSGIISKSPTYTMLYGDLAMIVITLFYLYLMAYVLFLGAHINAFIAEQGSDRILALIRSLSASSKRRSEARRALRSSKNAEKANGTTKAERAKRPTKREPKTPERGSRP